MEEKKFIFEDVPPKIPNPYPCTNILKNIASREFGQVRKSSFEAQVTRLKVQQLKNSVIEFEIDPVLSDCKFLRAGDNGCLIGVWQKNMDPASRHSSVYHLKFEYKPLYCIEIASCPIIYNLSCSGPFFKRMDITDMCERNINGESTLLYVGNTAVSGGRMVLNMSSTESSLSEVIWRSSKCIWSCASNAFLGRHAAGTEKGCYIFDHRNCKEVENSQTNVLAVEFSKDGHLLYCGRDKEELLLYDTRQDIKGNVVKQPSSSLGLSGIKEIKLLSDEVTMVICGTDGKLHKADLRMKQAIFQYPEYINVESDRRPFSVDEGLDLLCATGDDNISRIWSLQSGELMKNIRPVHLKTRSHACLVSDQRRWSVAFVQSHVLTPIMSY